MEYKSWNTCEECGDKGHPHATKEWKEKHWIAITVSKGQECPDCGAKDVTLVPLDDYRFQDTPYWD